MVEVEVELNGWVDSRVADLGRRASGSLHGRADSEYWERGLREGGKVVGFGLVLWLSQKSLLFPVLVFSFQVLTLILTGSFRRAS